MAATLILSLAGRVGAAVARLGFVTRGMVGPGPTGREPDPDSDWEPEERELQELERLAEGFDVRTDVIQRFLKSKFVPTVKQKLKQDQKVLKKPGLAHLVRQLQGSEDSTKPLGAGHAVSESFLEASSRASDHQRKPKSSISDCVGTRNTDSNFLPSDKKLEEWKADELGDQNFNSKVVQKGQEFFDSSGNFLYRI
ncbi:Neugrin [Heterocephalus glaber]|uniref:Neugrin n=1 Tax=Heterocephalus glaber TaxID=10181 RepID=G5BQZ4_HETGA|nr:Neugrin [Heterocephalus glaber]